MRSTSSKATLAQLESRIHERIQAIAAGGVNSHGQAELNELVLALEAANGGSTGGVLRFIGRGALVSVPVLVLALGYMRTDSTEVDVGLESKAIAFFLGRGHSRDLPVTSEISVKSVRIESDHAGTIGNLSTTARPLGSVQFAGPIQKGGSRRALSLRPIHVAGCTRVSLELLAPSVIRIRLERPPQSDKAALTRPCPVTGDPYSIAVDGVDGESPEQLVLAGGTLNMTVELAESIPDHFVRMLPLESFELPRHFSQSGLSPLSGGTIILEDVEEAQAQIKLREAEWVETAFSTGGLRTVSIGKAGLMVQLHGTVTSFWHGATWQSPDNLFRPRHNAMPTRLAVIRAKYRVADVWLAAFYVAILLVALTRGREGLSFEAGL